MKHAFRRFILAILQKGQMCRSLCSGESLVLKEGGKYEDMHAPPAPKIMIRVANHFPVLKTKETGEAKRADR